MKIVQFDVSQKDRASSQIYGLGDDGNVYTWSFEVGRWTPYMLPRQTLDPVQTFTSPPNGVRVNSAR